MLTRLAIRNIVLIEALELEFSGGLGVLTGETGAGKSILLDALGLLLGNRADSGLVRSGADKASVSGSFEFADLPAGIAAILDDAGIEREPGEPLLIRRQVGAEGGSKAFVNDQPVGVALLRELAQFLVELHGQHDDRGLVNPRGHRMLLDRYARTDVAGVEASWHAWRGLEDRLVVARARTAQASADRDLLLAHLAELVTLAPEAEEEDALAQARSAMQKGEKLADDLAALQHLWTGSDSALAEDNLARAGEALAHDPMELDRIETRLFELRAAARKNGCRVGELPDRMLAMRGQLDAIEGGEAEIAALEAGAHEAQLEYQARAEALSAQRFEASQRLDAAVAAELAPLKLDAARLRTAVVRLADDRWGPGGIDAVEFLVSTNPGADFGALGKIASGGELSRFILALKVALAEEGGAATVIFDEIDRGVGGAVASAIGERLARLASSGQLLAVTHSPQVAARGNRHYLIEKSSEGTVTRTSVHLLDAAGRKEEIARMLSGAEITAEARAQADRLLEGV